MEMYLLAGILLLLVEQVYDRRNQAIKYRMKQIQRRTRHPFGGK